MLDQFKLNNKILINDLKESLKVVGGNLSTLKYFNKNYLSIFSNNASVAL